MLYEKVDMPFHENRYKHAGYDLPDVLQAKP